MTTNLPGARLILLLWFALSGFAMGCDPQSAQEQTPVRAERQAPLPDAPLRPPKREVVEARSQKLTTEMLQTLGYVDDSHDPASDLRDVIVYDAERASDGFNFYSTRKQTGAQLIDMQGREVHSWNTDQPGRWQHAELLADGSVLVIVKDLRLSRYDAASNLLWSVEGRFHHDLWVHRGKIYALARTARLTDTVHPRIPTLIDVIQVRALDGTLEREISVLEAIRNSQYRFLLPSVSHERFHKEGAHLDILHTNHVEVFDGRLGEQGDLFAEGNLLISIRNINTIAILDGRSLDVIWAWGPTNVTFQHHPTLLDNGHILLFDNGSERSRVLELDPHTLEIVWQYGPVDGFFSQSRGSNQRLPNGNTLITESDRGYVFEVTPGGDTVWKFANPAVLDDRREVIWRMKRFDPASLDFLE